MGVLEIVLLAAGALIFAASFCIPVKREELNEENKKFAEAEIKALIDQELEEVRRRVTELSEGEVESQVEKSERSMERISNEKIMAVNEYSDTVLEEIHKNHEEVVFLYDMMKDKKERLDESLSSADQNIRELLQQVKDSEITIREGLKQLEEKKKELAAMRGDIPVTRTSVSAKRELHDGMQKEEPVTGLSRIAAAAAANRAVRQEETAVQEVPGKRKAAETPAFQPFEPVKVDAVPKKTRAGRTTKKAETAEREKLPVKTGRAKASRQENVGVELRISSSSEGKAGKNSNERILELHKAGKSNMAIARDLGLGIGEVKLVIDLYEGLR